jgi:hypothetical protein
MRQPERQESSKQITRFELGFLARLNFGDYISIPLTGSGS